MSIDEKDRPFFEALCGLYRGASDAELAKATGVSEEQVRAVRESWLSRHPAAKELLERPRETPPRFRMTDINGNVVTLRHSSLATQAAVRIFVEDMHGAEAIEWVPGQGWRPMEVPQATGTFGKWAFTPGGIGISMHLNRAQARALGEALLAFANEKEGT